MSESCREKLPLLPDDFSDEELQIRKNPKLYRLFRHSTSSGRARTQALGAAAIITRWPEHFSSLLAYWWIGLGMIAFMIFVMYNSITAISMLPPTHFKPVKYYNTEYSSVSNKKSETNVYMHIFVSDYEELDINNYLPYINTFSKKYININYIIIAVLNDISNNNSNDLSDELNNEIALNSLWMDKKKDDKVKLEKNINIQFVSLTKYMDDSPLRKYWRRLPQRFYGFLARCIAIWEKGGVAFDPLILTPNSPNSGYTAKLDHILSSLGSRHFKKTAKENTFQVSKIKLNNIRDIIDNLENQDKNIMQNNLLEAENKRDIYKLESVRSNKIKRNTKEVLLMENLKKNGTVNKTRYSEETIHKIKSENTSILSDKKSSDDDSSFNIEHKNEPTAKQHLLPMFLEYLFQHPKNITEYTNEQSNLVVNVTFDNNSSKSILRDNLIRNKKNNSINLIDEKVVDTKLTKSDINTNDDESIVSISVDLKGNLISTETPCHAFIGSIFSNALHHSDDESITDFVITELTIFCKGVISSCKGVDVILI